MASEAIGTIFKIVQTINKIVEEVQCNKQRCKRLSDRISSIVDIVKDLDTHMENQKEKSGYMNALEQLKSCLVSTQEYIETFTEKGGFKKGIMTVIGRNKIKQEFDGLNQQLTDLVPVLTFGMQVEADSKLSLLSDKAKLKEEDDGDEKIDWEEIEEIIKGLPDKLDEVGEKVDQMGDRVGDKVDGVKEVVDEVKEMVGRLQVSPSQTGKPNIQPPVDLQTITLRDLTDLTQIGQGRFGRVYKGKYLRKQIHVAVKRMDDPDNTKPYKQNEVAEELIKEATRMKQVETENVVRVWGICTDPGSILLVMEYMEKGPLRKVLRDEKIQLPWKLRVRMAMEGARGLYAIHNAGAEPMLHRNLSSKAFLVDEDLHVKISGFGFTKTLSSAKRAGGKKTNDEYVAPEQLKDINCYNQKNEIFAFGIVMWEIATRKVPYEGMDQRALLKSKETEKIPEGIGCPDDFCNIIDKCRGDDPLSRPQAREIIDKLESVLEVVS